MREFWINIYRDIATGKIYRGYIDWADRAEAEYWAKVGKQGALLYRIHVRLK